MGEEHTQGSVSTFLPQVRGHVSQSRMTIRYAIGKNTTEGMTHMMCIEGTEGEQPQPLLCPHPRACAGPSQTPCGPSLQAVRIPNRASQS